MKPCLEWPTRDHLGYGIRKAARLGHHTRLRHRQAWIEVHGPIPDGEEIHHLCKNKACYEITHLVAVDHRTNCAEDPPPGPASWRTGRCLRGHDITLEENVYRSPSGGRTCLPCKKATQKKAYIAKKGR